MFNNEFFQAQTYSRDVSIDWLIEASSNEIEKFKLRPRRIYIVYNKVIQGIPRRNHLH